MEKLQLTINGKKHTVLVEEHAMLSSVIREQIGLTGTKIGCEQGSCGACTVLMDGKPVLSCITPALKCEEAELVTIEGLAEGASLHELQKKFVEHGAIQCGFCTPAMVMTALSLSATLSKEEDPAILKEKIKDGLSGNV